MLEKLKRIIFAPYYEKKETKVIMKELKNIGASKETLDLFVSNMSTPLFTSVTIFITSLFIMLCTSGFNGFFLFYLLSMSYLIMTTHRQCVNLALKITKLITSQIFLKTFKETENEPKTKD